LLNLAANFCGEITQVECGEFRQVLAFERTRRETESQRDCEELPPHAGIVRHAVQV